MSSSYFMLKILRKKRLKKQLTKTAHKHHHGHERNGINDISSICAGSMKCRVCLKYGSIPIYTSEASFDISDAIRTISGIDISEDDAYPKYLCEACHSLLHGAVLFRKSAKEADKILRQSPSVKIDVSTDVEDGSNYSNDWEPVVKSYKCKTCKLNFRSWDEYVTHKSTKKHKNVRIQCPICYGLLTAQLYHKHLARHQSASHLICDVCGKLYRKDNLVRHLQLHSYELPFQCQVCPYRGRFMESLKIHMRTHSGDKPYSCDKCELRFLTSSNLNRHLLTHKKEKPFKCIECGRGFYTKRDMDVHFKADHAGIKDYSCRICGNKYGTKKALMRHELRVHKRDKMAKGRLPLYLQAEYRRSDEIM